ncbi:hypothetical protein TNCT_615271 [Trichonephila clavata]|uniref:Uncharacterized protein n=1 Tax=Trichonephila clavata TaxID=2740835 RepID=A0A8X6I5M9_TRICU|nr:hypothetical protein TNCT_615271 [Trichonephila clavata]
MKVTERLPPMSGGANALNIQQMQQLSLQKTRCLLIKQVRSVSWGKNYQNEMKVRIVPNSTAAAPIGVRNLMDSSVLFFARLHYLLLQRPSRGLFGWLGEVDVLQRTFVI